MRLVVLAIVVAACSSDERPARTQHEIDAVTFRHMLRDRDQASGIEEIRIEPDRDATARYVVTRKTTAVADAVHAEFPGELVDDIVAAGIPYQAAAIGERIEGGRVIDAIAFRAMLRAPDAIAAIIIVPSNRHTARYDIISKVRHDHTLVYAEFPGSLVDLIAEAGIPYGTRILDDSEVKLKPIDGVSFRHMLTDRDEASRVEKIRIEPTGRGDARYIITWKDRDARGAANAEFPGKLVGLIVAAAIPYSVERPD